MVIGLLEACVLRVAFVCVEASLHTPARSPGSALFAAFKDTVMPSIGLVVLKRRCYMFTLVCAR